MQKNDQAEKHKWEIDGVEISGLVKSGEYVAEKGTLDVPEFAKLRKIQNGIATVPPIEATYKLKKGSNTLKFFRDWYNNDESKEIVKIRTDATGIEFARTIYQDCECVKYTEPEFDAANPTYAQVQLVFLPYEVIPLDAQ